MVTKLSPFIVWSCTLWERKVDSNRFNTYGITLKNNNTVVLPNQEPLSDRATGASSRQSVPFVVYRFIIIIIILLLLYYYYFKEP